VVNTNRKRLLSVLGLGWHNRNPEGKVRETLQIARFSMRSWEG
jgi:hypothetical protein